MSEKDIIDVFGGLVESFDLECCCEECAKYAKRIFSIDGKDKRFPILPDCIKYYNNKHKYCQIPLNAFLFGVDEPRWSYRAILLIGRIESIKTSVQKNRKNLLRP